MKVNKKRCSDIRVDSGRPGAGTAVAVADDDLLAVLAHGWINSMSVVTGAAQTLLTHHASLTPEARADLLEMIVTQARYLEDFLSDVFLSARPEVRLALIEIQSRTGAPGGPE